MKFREWFESMQKADLLCWADEEAAATGWNAALTAVEEDVMATDGIGNSAFVFAAIFALKEQA